MPEWCGDHKFTMASAHAFQSRAARLGLPNMISSAGLARITRQLTRLGLAATVAVSSLAGGAAPAQAQGLPIVRDAEIEALVREYAKPVLQAAGLQRQNVQIILVNDPSFNAFVDGRRIFVNTGLLVTAQTPNEVIGVLAHEAGHLAGGHQERLRQQMARAQTMAVIGLMLGLGTMAAGAASKTNELGGVGGAIAAGSGEVAKRTILSYQRTEETTADRSALKYLEATGQSAKGMLATFKRFQSALALSGAKIDPYQVSHPMPRERIANLEVLARKSPYFEVKDSPTLQKRHDRMRAKIAAYTGGKGATASLFRKKDQDADAKQYGEAIEGYLRSSPRMALPKIDAMIKAEPKNPYYYELRGDALMKANKPVEAAEAYQRAVKLDPARSSTLQIAYGQALLAQGGPKAAKKAVAALESGLAADDTNAAAYRYLSQAYGQLGDVAQAELAAAEGYYHSNNFQQSKIFAMRAQRKLRPNSPNWLRAQDIINYRQPGKKRRGLF